MLMRVLLLIVAGLGLATPPALAADQFQCSQIPHAQQFLDGLKPGPNTSAAQQHLDAAKAAHSDQQCVAELKKVDYYARRSAAADKAATRPKTAHRARHVQCADALHQNRPGGSDYHGPAVAGCPRLGL
jgi:hypothetical protein